MENNIEDGYVRVSLVLPLWLVEKAKDFARRKGWTFTEVVRQGLADTMYLKDRRDRGWTVQTVSPDGRVSSLTWDCDRE